MANIIIAEDDDDLRASFVDYLSQAGHLVKAAADALGFYQQLATQSFDIALLDVNLPQQDGFSIAKHVYENSDMAIIIATGRGEVDDRITGYSSGADVYLVKPVDCAELSAAIDALTRRRAKTAGREITPTWSVDRVRLQLCGPDGRSVDLTRKESQLLELFAANPETIIHKQEMLSALGYDGAKPESRALDVAVSRLRSKVLSSFGQTLPLQTVQNAGYTFVGQISVN